MKVYSFSSPLSSGADYGGVKLLGLSSHSALPFSEFYSHLFAETLSQNGIAGHLRDSNVPLFNKDCQGGNERTENPFDQ